MANLLTVARIVLIPAILYPILDGSVPHALAWVLALLGLSALTDVADGWIARRRGEVSATGALLDPLADKLTLVALLLALAWRGWVPFWPAALLLVKEGLQVLGAAWVLRRRRRVVPARWPGKAATVLLYGGVGAVLVGWRLGPPLLLAGVLSSVGAGIYYAALLLRPPSGPA